MTGGKQASLAGAESCAGHTRGGSCWTRWQQLQGSHRTGPCQQWPRQMALLVLSVQENCLGLSPALSQPAVPTPAPCSLATVSDCPQVPRPATRLTLNLSSFHLSLFKKSLHSLSPKLPHSLPCSSCPFSCVLFRGGWDSFLLVLQYLVKSGLILIAVPWLLLFKTYVF